MNDVAKMRKSERDTLVSQSAARRSVTNAIIEKDFWACWTLKQLFENPIEGVAIIFKGGTSLSKAYGAIERFSEDIDLSFNRADLGFAGENDPIAASSRKKRERLTDQLRDTCKDFIAKKYLPHLGKTFETVLEQAPGELWRIEIDPEDQEVLFFHYPSTSKGNVQRYLQPFVRLELGARSEHWPSEAKEIKSYIAEHIPKAFTHPTCNVNVVAGERTFWEKTTILHRCFHTPTDKQLPMRQSRHYYDIFKLYHHEIGKRALADTNLLKSVAEHANKVFGTSWAKYSEAIPGTLRLVPPSARTAELSEDYAQMKSEMIFGNSPSFEEIIEVLKEIERIVNQ